MSNSSNKNLHTMSKSNKSKSQKVDIDGQSALVNSVLTGLINNIVERTKSLQKSSPNNSSESELQENPESKLQELEYVPSVQEFEFEFELQKESDLELSEEFVPEIEMPEELVTESEMQETDMNEYVKVYHHLGLNTYKDWIKNILPNIAGKRMDS
ncbi:hypothetical protein F8M41_001931 [Gigaspora margarita]|uniref:Uncharacterized protein n=1 Tax=Gigaspora margarita TaxID=4874 RepID=A0A8H4AYV9_GIGMA|nr:hypothetical protein F8M41_001931 [Gigaspora margarita]